MLLHSVCPTERIHHINLYHLQVFLFLLIYSYSSFILIFFISLRDNFVIPEISSIENFERRKGEEKSIVKDLRNNYHEETESYEHYALKFMKETMTLGGIIKGPGGQPAMYECKNGNSKDPGNYGKVDKPQFLWASAWYLYTLYNLLGYRENEWNISFSPYIPQGQDKTEYEIIAGGKQVKVENKEKGNYIQDIKYDGVSCPSAVIPEDPSPGKRVEITAGNPENPYISSAGSILLKPSFDRSSGKFKFTLKSFPGHFTGTEIVSPRKLKTISLNGKDFDGSYKVNKKDGIYIINISYSQENENDTFELQFELPESGSH